MFAQTSVVKMEKKIRVFYDLYRVGSRPRVPIQSVYVSLSRDCASHRRMSYYKTYCYYCYYSLEGSVYYLYTPILCPV